jgi:hypothetical protein
VSACNVGQLEISNSQYNIAKICRSTDFYIDPNSSDMLELGTKTYPYRSFKSVASKILNQFSFRNLNVSINLKEGSRLYLEDDTTYFISLGVVTIQSYSDTSVNPLKTLLVPTAIPQHGISERAAFHILNNTDLLINETIAVKNYADAELEKLRAREVTLKVVESSLSLVNINAYRETVDYNSAKTMISPIYLQNRTITISKYIL